jgi:hypothetical protein
MLMAFDTVVRRENTDVRWVGFHPPKGGRFKITKGLNDGTILNGLGWVIEK